MENTDMVNAEELGFTEDDLKPFADELPKEEEPKETEEQTETTEDTSETASVGEETTVTEDHAENLKAALKEERARRKALRDELDTLKNQLIDVQRKSQPAPIQQTDPFTDLKKQARQKAIESLKIDGNPSDLMFTDSEKYEEFVAERARLEYEAIHNYQEKQRTYNENVSFVNELRSIPDFPVVLNYAMADLDEMPRKQSRKIEDAYSKVDRGEGTKEDFQVLRDYVAECQKKMAGTNTSETTKTQPQTNVGGLTSKLEQASQLPKATQLNGGKTSQMSWAEVEKLAREEKWDEIPKELLLKIDPTGSLLK